MSASLLALALLAARPAGANFKDECTHVDIASPHGFEESPPPIRFIARIPKNGFDVVATIEPIINGGGGCSRGCPILPQNSGEPSDPLSGCAGSYLISIPLHVDKTCAESSGVMDGSPDPDKRTCLTLRIDYKSEPNGHLENFTPPSDLKELTQKALVDIVLPFVASVPAKKEEAPPKKTRLKKDEVPPLVPLPE
jgi:hypothetical protein